MHKTALPTIIGSSTTTLKAAHCQPAEIPHPPTRSTANKRPPAPRPKSLADGGRAGEAGRGPEGFIAGRARAKRPYKTRVIPARPASRVITSAMRPSRVLATRVAAAKAMAISTMPATREIRRSTQLEAEMMLARSLRMPFSQRS